MKPRHVRILDGSTFVVSDVQGDIDARPDEAVGFFYRDTRHLSTWRLLLDGRPLDALTTEEVGYDAAVFFLVVPTGTIYKNPTLSAERRRFVGDGLREELALRNHGSDSVRLELSLLFGSDFADIFEVKDSQSKTGELYRRATEHGAILGYRRDDFVRETHITAPGAFFTEGSLTYRVDLEPGQQWQAEVEVETRCDGTIVRPKQRSSHRQR